MDAKTRGRGLSIDGSAQLLGPDLFDGATCLADQQARIVRPVRPKTGNVGVQRVDPVDEPMRQQKLERAIHRWRRGLGVSLKPQTLQKVIGADRHVARANELENVASQGRQPGRRLKGAGLGGRDGFGHARGMVMLIL